MGSVYMFSTNPNSGNVQDSSKGKIGSAIQTQHELQFKAHSASDAERWWSIIRGVAGEANFTDSAPTSPVESRNVSGNQKFPPQYQDSKQPAPVQTQGLPQGGQTSGTVASAGTGFGASPATSGATPTSGVTRAPGQY